MCVCVYMFVCAYVKLAKSYKMDKVVKSFKSYVYVAVHTCLYVRPYTADVCINVCTLKIFRCRCLSSCRMHVYVFMRYIIYFTSSHSQVVDCLCKLY